MNKTNSINKLNIEKVAKYIVWSEDGKQIFFEERKDKEENIWYEIPTYNYGVNHLKDNPDYSRYCYYNEIPVFHKKYKHELIIGFSACIRESDKFDLDMFGKFIEYDLDKFSSILNREDDLRLSEVDIEIIHSFRFK